MLKVINVVVFELSISYRIRLILDCVNFIWNGMDNTVVYSCYYL